MTLIELQKALRAAHEGAVLVPARVLEQIIQEACNLRGSAWNTPHRECFVVDRQTLFRHIEQAYLDLEPDQLLPDTVILLARPPAEELSDLESKHVLIKYWRRLFHASVHLTLDANRNQSEDKLRPDRLRERLEEIGRSEFEEIRTVLRQDHHLLPEADDREVYTEFASIYLETRWFAASLLPVMFPAIRDFGQIEQMLAKDIDAKALFDRTRLGGAPDPVVVLDTGSEEPQSHELFWTLVRSAERANLENDLVRGAILRIRAARIAPAALGQRTRDQAMADMKKLTARLAAVLNLTPAEAQEWDKDLPLLLDKADQGAIPAEARLLYELQRICVHGERDLFTLDMVEWLLSAGKRPIKRHLPRLQQVRITRNLRSATRHLSAVRLHDVDRRHFSGLVQAALTRAEENIREQFGEVLRTALQDVGLQPVNPPERVARSKMVAEWLDRIIDHGFLTFGDLRDTISRNQLKMPDLKDPRDLVRGDPLLRLDRRLASLLDGVYRPSDMYMRWLEKLTALNFGTGIGRKLTLWVTLPLGGAELLLQFFGLILHFVVNIHERLGASRIYHALAPQSKEGYPTDVGPHWPWHLVLLGLFGSFLMAVLHADRVRRRCADILQSARGELRRVFITIPAELVRKAALQKLLRSWQFHFLSYVVKPLILTGVIWLLLPRDSRPASGALIVFLVSALLLNSRLGQAMTEAVWQAIKTFWVLLRSGLLPGVFRLVLRVFKQVIDAIEVVLFTVDDWLRYRKGDSAPSLVIRTAMGVLWFPFSYVSRFFMLVMIEPGFNPAKAPVSYLAAKVTWPFAPTVIPVLVGALQPYVGLWLAEAICWPTYWLLPDAFGFLFWETSENWSLYKSNRRRTLHAAQIGPRGETVKALLLPGFHSGTVPRIYARLREAEQRACWTRNWTAARACRQELDGVCHSIERFVSRELLALLEQSPNWESQRVTVGKTELSIKRITIELNHAEYPTRPVQIVLELRETYLVAAVRDTGWLERLTPDQLHIFTAALASLYKLAGVDLVVEHIAANLPSPAATWEVTADGLEVTFDPQSAPVLYHLRDRLGDTNNRRHATDGDSTVAGAAPAIDPSRLVFARHPLNWQKWVTNWEKPSNGNGTSEDGDWHQQLVLLPAGSNPTLRAAVVEPQASPVWRGDALRTPDQRGNGDQTSASHN